MKKKVISILLVCLLLCGTAFAEAGLPALVDSFGDLALAANNVSLKAEASFTLDGTLFKTMHAYVKQDYYHSYLQYMLDTPRANGTVYTGGYTVVGFDNMAYSNDTYYGNYYSSITQESTDTILRNTGANRRIMLALKACAASAQGLLDEFAYESDGEGMKYTVKCADLPDVVDSALYYLAAQYLNDNYEVDLSDNIYPAGPVPVYEDYEYLVHTAYKTLFGEEMPETYWDENIYGRYSIASSLVYQTQSEVLAGYSDGYIFFRADGTNEYFATEEDYRRATGDVYLTYENYFAALSACHEALYGKPLTTEEINALYSTGNSELNDALDTFIGGLDDYFISAALAQNPDAVYARVYADGTIKTSDTMPLEVYGTIANSLLHTMTFASLKDIDAVITVDGEGRITGAEGSVNIEVLDGRKRAHTVGITFSGLVFDYGTTETRDWFDPADYGWVSYDEYVEQIGNAETTEGEENATDEQLPEKVTFMGAEYEVMLDGARE